MNLMFLRASGRDAGRRRPGEPRYTSDTREKHTFISTHAKYRLVKYSEGFRSTRTCLFLVVGVRSSRVQHAPAVTLSTTLMLPESAEVMRRATDACVAPNDNTDRSQSADNKELLRQQLLNVGRVSPDECDRPKHSRNRQKNRWKLKFHHQALPQEYLDHYEQSLQRANAAERIKQEKIKSETGDDNMANEALEIWTRRSANAFSNMTHKQQRSEEKKRRHAPAIAPSKIVTYDDLPYMGEMTLNNSKPRRGRKPKKADICHLIYENYGTVVPGQPPHDADDRPVHPACRPTRVERVAPFDASKTDLQNKIISSLLERKLSQENRRRAETPTPRRAPDEPPPAAPPAGRLHGDCEPLNLCIRDLHELKIQIQKKFGNIYSSLPDVKEEVVDAEDGDDDRKNEQPNAISVIQRNTNLTTGRTTASSSPDLGRRRVNVSPTLSEPAHSTPSPDADGEFPPNYVYWPDAGVYMHPLALQTQLLYYRRLAAAGRTPIVADERERAPSTATGVFADAPTPPADDSKTKLVLKQISELLDPKVIKRAEDAKKSPERTKRASPNPPTRQGPVKRKRSAIFIPPIPPKNNSTTPTAEVSICKFKFTGGSKPSLQEKKMLSVDSGGNFRYYSGGGGKGNKGHERVDRQSASEAGTSGADRGPGDFSVREESKKKRKSRKSLQREKLEQTFKEKGFLIQTQQLQSAEGATYCKFRQLRKFTRYLFRSWKDYLPGELEERPTEAAGASDEAQKSVAGEWG